MKVWTMSFSPRSYRTTYNFKLGQVLIISGCMCLASNDFIFKADIKIHHHTSFLPPHIHLLAVGIFSLRFVPSRILCHWSQIREWKRLSCGMERCPSQHIFNQGFVLRQYLGLSELRYILKWKRLMYNIPPVNNLIMWTWVSLLCSDLNQETKSHKILVCFKVKIREGLFYLFLYWGIFSVAS